MKWWMRLVGALYVLLGIGFIPFINELRIATMIPGMTVPPGSVEYKALIDWTFFFGLDLLVTGAVLIVAARDPKRNLILVWLVIALEIVRGLLADIYYIGRGYASIPFYVGFMTLHLVIIVSGILLARQTAQETGPEQRAVRPGPSATAQS